MNLDINRYFELLLEGKNDEAEAVRQSFIPDTLLKFVWLDDNETSNERKFLTLENDEIWFTSRDVLNDPYEFRGLVVDEEKLKEKNYSVDEIRTISDLIKYDDYGVTCLTSNKVDFLPMWAYYTNNHQGYCVEYSVENKSCIHEVSYENSKSKVALLLCEAIEEGRNCMKNGKVPSPKLNALMKLFTHNMFMKHESWKHEAEYRIVYPLNGKKGINVPAMELGMKTMRIVAGINCSIHNIERLNVISKKLGLGSVNRIHLHEGEYSLLIER